MGTRCFSAARCGVIWRSIAPNSLAKGMRVVAQGRLTQRSWEDEQHQKRSSVELQVDEIGPSLRYATAQVSKAQRGTAERMAIGFHAGGLYGRSLRFVAAVGPVGSATGQIGIVR